MFLSTPIKTLALVLFTLCSVYGIDCEQIKRDIKSERNLLKKRTMLNQALETCPEDAELHYICAYTAERLRKYDKALAHYIKSTELDKSNSRAFFGLGDIHMVLGNAEMAIPAYEKGLKIKPEDSRAKLRMDLAKIKFKSQSGDQVTQDEFIKVMQGSKKKGSTDGAIDGPVLRMQIQFLVSSASFNQQAREQLLVVGQALQDPLLSKSKFEIAGHTDNIGSTDANLELSKNRAQAVRTFLLSNFDINPNNLKTVYYGSTRPAVPNTSSKNRAMNRRVEFRRLRD